MHKSSTRQYVARTAQRSWGLHPKLVADCVKWIFFFVCFVLFSFFPHSRFNLPATYKCHQKKSVDVTVDLFCFECGQKEVRNLLASYT
jgi:predicted RNA methylase